MRHKWHFETEDAVEFIFECTECGRRLVYRRQDGEVIFVGVERTGVIGCSHPLDDDVRFERMEEE